MGYRGYVLLTACGALILASVWRADVVVAQTPAAPATAASSSAAVLKQYCATCHSERTKSGGVVIDPTGVTDVASGAEHWEKVVRKLRTQSMPPPGVPRPDAASYDRVASFLETELDRLETARPHLGKMSQTHRLSRTEYRNAVRDLLALE